MSKCSRSKEHISWKTIIRDNVYSMRFLWLNSKTFLFISCLNMLICGLVGPAEVILTSRLLTILESGCAFSDAAINVLLMMAVGALKPCWSLFYDTLLIPKSQQKIHVKIQKQLFEKVRTIELERYDDPEFYNEYILAMQHADSYATAALENISNLISHVVSLAAIVGVLAYVDFVAMIIALASAVIAMVIVSQTQKIEYRKSIELISIERKDEYINRVFRQSDYAKELRLTNLGDKLIDDYNDNINAYIQKEKLYGKKENIAEILDSVNSQGIRIAIIAWTLFQLLIVGSVTLGGFTVVVNANWRLREALIGMGRHISSLPFQSRYIAKVRSFIEYEPKGRSGVLMTPKLREIVLKNVSFGYHKDEEILHDVNLTIHRGEKIAFVGYNGAGKTTLVKLIMGLYQPDSGTIMYNGTDICAYEMDSYRAHIGAVFQDFKIFAATIGENVMGDVCTEADRNTVEQALHIATFDDKLASLQNGIDTVLTREYDENGTNLSGGEAQKIAIARVFAHPFDLVIMDEPSASLDPIAEYKLNRHIVEYTKDKTVIFISHRLSTTRHVDCIYMFDNGRIIESGSHEELMNKNGKYAEIFRVQAEKYVM